MAHCPHVDMPKTVLAIMPPPWPDEYCCKCGEVRAPEHATESWHGPFLKEPVLKRLNPWLWDEVCKADPIPRIVRQG